MEPASLAGDELRVKAAKYFSDDPDFLRIITNAKVNVATLFNSQTLIREIVKKKDWEALSRFLMDAWKISNTEDSKKRQQTRSDEYDIRVINSDISPELLDRMAMKAHMSHSPWKLLIAGASGTGKSAYAYHLANKLDMEILVKRPQDVIFRYFGESETAIANAFREAESKNALLLFDENVLHTFFRADDAVVAERPDDYDRKCFDPADGEGIHQHPRLPFCVVCDYAERWCVVVSRLFCNKGFVFHTPFSNERRMRFYPKGEIIG